MNALYKVMLVIAVAMATVPMASIAQSLQKFPTKPIRFVLPISTGSQTDILARLIGEKMSANWGQPVVVDNRPGAGGLLATSAVGKAAPDGYTLLLTNTFAVSAALQPNLPYDSLKDFTGVAQIGYGNSILVVAPALGVNSLKDFVALAKAQPGNIVFGSMAVGSGAHLTGAKFNHAAGIKVKTVAFKGVSESVIEVVAGRIQYCISPLAVVLPFIKDGKLVPLAATRRLAVLPDVPEMAEVLPGFERSANSYGMLAPARTPRPILNQLSQEVSRILNLPDIKERLQPTGFILAPTTPEAYDRILREQIESFTSVARIVGLKAN
jgi:tripartite-type tricarboxylate transporter receptor subunit TctC